MRNGGFSVLLVLAVALSACGGSSTYSEPTSLEDAIAMQEDIDAAAESFPGVCDPLATFAAAKPELPPVTQCEIQDPGPSMGGRQLIIQFDDQSENAVAENLATDDYIFYPVDAVAQHLKLVRDEIDGLDTFIIAFRDECQTVFDIPGPLMRQFVDGQMTRAALLEQSNLSSLTYC